MNVNLMKKLALGIAISGAFSGIAVASSSDIDTNNMVNNLLNVESIQEIEKKVSKESKSTTTELIYDSQRSINNSNQITVLQEQLELLDVQIDLQDKQNILKEKREASALTKQIEANKILEEEKLELTEMVAGLEHELTNANERVLATEAEIVRLQAELLKDVATEVSDEFGGLKVVRIYGLGNNMKADVVWDNSLISRPEGAEVANGIIIEKVNPDHIIVTKGKLKQTLFMSIHKNVMPKQSN
ncbi:hypothetical protein LMH73_021250 [Vibrio splendidus]|nr:hypothetical protein [Vibrio splendidus]MCC4883274.1 hypothetical protein [Vibrio splendidus]